MTYNQSLNYLDSFLNLEKIDWSKDNRCWNLDRMKLLLEIFEHPEKSFTSVIIAGTKGKGSTGFFLESILCESKVKVGFYSSPHLIDPRERIRLQGKVVSKKIWAEGVQSIKRKLSTQKTPSSLGRFTYFEIATLLAALVFKKQNVKVALFEVGMGGRLDATNAMGAKLALITPIHKDHEAILGNTIAKIAREKAAVIARKGEVVVAPQKDVAMQVIRHEARLKNAKLFVLSKSANITTGLLGAHQKRNALLAKRASDRLRDTFGILIDSKKIARALQRKNWPGRLEHVGNQPNVYLDGAHNPAAVRALVLFLRSQKFAQPRVLLFGTQRDKNSREMLSVLSSYFDQVILVQMAGSRSQDVRTLMEEAKGKFPVIYPWTESARKALSFAKKIAEKKGLVLATGSFYLVGELKFKARSSKS